MTRIFAVFVLLLLCAACAPGSRSAVDGKGVRPIGAEETIFVVPFTAVMVPRQVRETIFDRFVDRLNEIGEVHGIEFLILKRGFEEVAASVRENHYLITGEIYSYVEESGCCSTDIRTRNRLSVFEPGASSPGLQFEYPKQVFFQHDDSSLVKQRDLLAKDVADQLAAMLYGAITADPAAKTAP